MLQVHSILHPTDFSDSSAAAFQIAASLAHDYGAKLTVLHVVPPPPVILSGEMPVLTPTQDPKYLATLQTRLMEIKSGYKDVVIDHKLVEGDPATEIIALANTAKPGLIVLGTHGRTGLSRLLMGSVAEQVSRKATAPVLLVKATNK